MIASATLFEMDTTFELIKGNVSLEICGISNTRNLKDGSFVFLKSKNYLVELNVENISEKSVGLIFEKKFFEEQKAFILEHVAFKSAKWCASVANVGYAMCLFSKPFYDQKFNDLNYFVDGRQMGTADVHPNADIAQGVFIGTDVVIEENVTIHPGVTIMPKVKIGKGTIIFPNVTIYPYVNIGDNCRIHSCSVIGADGFGYNFINGKHMKVWHFNGVTIKDDVEIGASSTVDGGAFEPTYIGPGTKIDNGVQVGHNCHIGDNCVICGQVAVAGSCVLEDYVVIGGRAGLSPNVFLGKGSQVAANAIVSENARWPAGSILGGTPAILLKDWMKYQAKLRLITKK